MKLNYFERLAIANPLRAALQRWYEPPLLQHLGGTVEGLQILDIGCGPGVGTDGYSNTVV